MASPLDIAQDGELFPREELLHAVAGADWRDLPVRLGAWLALALGATLLAAGLPVLHDLLPGPTTIAAEPGSLLLHPVHLAARTLGRAGLGIESAFFLIAALSYGAALLATGASLRAFGFSGRLSIVATLIAALSLPLLLHGRLPSPFPGAVAASALLLAATAAPADDEGPGYGLRVALAWAFASWIDHSILATLPACWIAVRARSKGASALAPLGVAGVVAAAVGAWAMDGPIDPSLAFQSGLPWWAHVVGPLGLLAPMALLARRDPEESGAPRWLVLWLLTAVLVTIASGLAGALRPAPYLIPALAVLVANVLTRRRRASDAARLAALCAGLQLLPVGAWAWASSGDGTPYDVRPGELLERDFVFIDRGAAPAAAYLLERRHGLWLCDTSEVEVILPAGYRVVSVERDEELATHWLDVETGEVRPRTPTGESR